MIYDRATAEPVFSSHVGLTSISVNLCFIMLLKEPFLGWGGGGGGERRGEERRGEEGGGGDIPEKCNLFRSFVINIFVW